MTAVRFLDRNKMVVYASENGVPMNANLGDPTVGTDASTALQSLIDAVATAGGGTVIIDGACKCHDIKLRSGITIQGVSALSWTGSGAAPKVGIIQSPNSVCIFRNFNWISPYNGGSPVTDFSTIVDHDIIVRDLFLNGNGGNGGVNNAAGGNADKRYVNNDGIATAGSSHLPLYPMIFFGVRNLQIGNVFVYDPTVGSLLVSYVDYGLLRTVRTISPAVYAVRSSPTTASVPFIVKPGAPYAGNVYSAVQLSGSCRNITVEKVSGYYGGAMVGVCTDALVWNNPTYYPTWYVGPATGVRIVDVFADLAASLLNLWSGSDPFLTPSVSLIDQLVADGLRGTVFLNAWNMDGPDQAVGTYGTSLIRHVDAILQAGTYTGTLSSMEGLHKDISLEKITFRIGAASAIGPFTGTDLIFMNFNPNGSVLVKITELVVIDTVTSFDYAVIYLTAATPGSLKDLTVANSSLYRSVGTPAGTLLRLHNLHASTLVNLSCVTVDGGKRVVWVSGGSLLTTVLTTGMSHTNAGGNASILVDASTLPRLRCSGSDTALLSATVNAGTITNKKTDATEDA